MAAPILEKAARPARLRTRLAVAFGLFAFVVVCALGLLLAYLWESSGGGSTHRVGVLLTAGTLVVAIAALGGYLVAGPLARPMERWAEAADRIGLGERDVSFPQSGGSHELARVSAALQSMFARLSEKEDALQERIQERTAALVVAVEALDAERRKLAAALEGSRLAYWELDLASSEIHLSSEWARMLGEPQGETVTSVAALLARVPEEEHAAISERVFAVLKGEVDQYDLDHRVRRADGQWMWIRSRGRVTTRDAEGRARTMVGTNVDVGPRKAQEERRALAETRANLLMESMASCVCHVDLTGRVLFANRRYHQFYGLADGSAAGKHVRDVAGEEGAAAFERCLPQLLSGNEVSYSREARVQGRKVVIEMRLMPQRDAQGVTESVYAMLTEVTGTNAAERLLERQARRDPTTGLPNRRSFLEAIEHALVQSRRLGGGTAVLCVGLDGFRALNEELGQEAGDALLRQAGARYVAAVRSIDSVARLEGDTFGVLLESCRSGDDADVVARKLTEALRPAFDLPSGKASATCTVGIAVAPADGEEPEALLRSAERALGRAKRAGRAGHARQT